MELDDFYMNLEELKEAFLKKCKKENIYILEGNFEGKETNFFEVENLGEFVNFCNKNNPKTILLEEWKYAGGELYEEFKKIEEEYPEYIGELNKIKELEENLLDKICGLKFACPYNGIIIQSEELSKDFIDFIETRDNLFEEIKTKLEEVKKESEKKCSMCDTVFEGWRAEMIDEGEDLLCFPCRQKKREEEMLEMEKSIKSCAEELSQDSEFIEAKTIAKQKIFTESYCKNNHPNLPKQKINGIVERARASM